MNGNLFEHAGATASKSSEWFTAHCDGGSRGNPGPSGYGAVIEDSTGHVVARLSEFLGIQTNNYAEYSGLLSVMNWALENGRRLRVVSDSELMVKQMKGQYRVSSPVLRPLWEQARKIAKQLDGFEISHTLRAGNKEADRLANEAMDRGMGKPVGSPTANAYAKPPQQPKPAVAGAPRPAAAPKPERQVLEGYVKDGVVHLLGGELPDGVFVKVVRE